MPRPPRRLFLFRHLGPLAVILAVVLGVTVGLGAYTFNYAEGLSYFSTDPKACVNCHIMRDEYDSWAKSGHHHVAVCNDCHLPHALVPKLIAKSRNGWNHSSAFTLQNFHEPIIIGPKNAEILQENCLRCHAEFVHTIVVGASRDPDGLRCVQCHRGAGHGATGRWE